MRQPAFPRSYIFNHVPKTGGNSLLAVCRQNLTDSEISPHLWGHDLRMRSERYEHYRLIRGHFSVLGQAGFARDRYSITLLRHPIRTIISAYHFGRAFPEPTTNSATLKAKTLSLREFVRYFADSTAVIHNPYTHHFAALPIDFPGVPEDESSLLEAARHNLAAFDFVGITEELEASVGLLCDQLGWPVPVTTPVENSSGSGSLFERIEPETMGLLVEHNKLDLELYDFAKTLFHERGQDPSFRPLERNRFVAFPAPYEPQRDASIHSVSATYHPGEPRGTLQISIDFRTKARIETLMAGTMITDLEGSLVYGTNTLLENLEVRNAPHCDCRTTFVLDCDAAPGRYFVTVALSDLRRPGFNYHWIERATSFTIAPGGAPAGTQSVRLRRFESTMEAAS